MTQPTTPHVERGSQDVTFSSGQSSHDRAAQLTLAGGLVAAITHDLRQPLTALEMNIAAALHFLRMPEPHVDDALEALRDALDQHGRMRESLQVIEGLAVHREPLCVTMDLLPIVREVVLLVQSDVLARHVSIEIDVSPPVPNVHADPTLMRQALLNIVLDALEATSSSAGPHRPVSLTIRQVEDTVEVAVTHFGLRTDSATIDDWGLALARSVVEAHHGTIMLEGDADAGVRLITRWPMTPHGIVHEDHHAE